MYKCTDCGRNIDRWTTSGQPTKKGRKTLRCGRCYLKHRAEVRRRRGEQ